jgi:hypothetical protein
LNIQKSEKYIDTGKYDLNIMNILEENLIGISEIVNNEFNILFSKNNVEIFNSNSNDTILKIPRSKDGMWRLKFTINKYK